MSDIEIAQMLWGQVYRVIETLPKNQDATDIVTMLTFEAWESFERFSADSTPITIENDGEIKQIKSRFERPVWGTHGVLIESIPGVAAMSFSKHEIGVKEAVATFISLVKKK